MALVAQWVKNLPAKQEMQVRSLDLEDPLEEVMATHFSIVAWELHGQRSLVCRTIGSAVYRVTKSRTRLKRLSRHAQASYH